MSFKKKDQEAIAKLVMEMNKPYNEMSFHSYNIGDFVDGWDGQEVIVNIDQDGTIFTMEVSDEGNSYSVEELSQASGQDASNMGKGDIVTGYDGEEIIVNIKRSGKVYTLVLGQGGNKYTKKQLDKANGRALGM